MQTNVPTQWGCFIHDCLNLWHWFIDKVPPKFAHCEICTEPTSYRIGTDKTKYPFYVQRGPLVCRACYDTIFNPYKRIR